MSIATVLLVALLLLVPSSAGHLSMAEPAPPAASTAEAPATIEAPVTVGAPARQEGDLREVNHQIRREKFDLVLPEVMRSNDVDMWIHVMRESIEDPFGAQELGSTSGTFVFTDRGGDRIERAILGRRWGRSHASETWEPHWETDLVEEADYFDIVRDPVLVKQPPGGPLTEYDHRFKGLREFVEERDPDTIAVNYLEDFGPYPTQTRWRDGMSHTDYLLLQRELGEEYADRLVSSERLIMGYTIRKVPTEIEWLKQKRQEEDERIREAFESVVPGETRNRDVGLTVFRRRGVGVSQRGRTPGHQNVVIQGGDILAAVSQGTYAYVLREGETEPPEDIQRIWAAYQKVDAILAETIRVGRTPREIVEDYERKLADEGFVIREEQLHLFTPRNDFSAYTAGHEPGKIHLNIDCHGMAKGARERKVENYFGPRIGSNGPEWMWDIPLPPNHHFVLEYFIYMPWPSGQHENQYLFWWDHEQALAGEDGVEYLSPPQEELYLIGPA